MKRFFIILINLLYVSTSLCTVFDFIFITSEDDSPLQRYNEFVAEQELKNTYRINADQYRYLRQLFRFNGIPRHVLVDKEGRILDNNIDYFTPYGFDLEKLIKK